MKSTIKIGTWKELKQEHKNRKFIKIS